MAVLAQRKRVIDTFVAKELAQASRKMINNTEAFRALKGECVHKKVGISNDENIEEQYKEYLKLMG